MPTTTKPKELAERTPYLCYRYEGIPFVPHYTEPGFFVAPGNIIVNEAWLRQQGATPISMNLWSRP